jgi:hypothetical protein
MSGMEKQLRQTFNDYCAAKAGGAYITSPFFRDRCRQLFSRLEASEATTTAAAKPGGMSRPAAPALAQARRADGRQRARRGGLHGFPQPAPDQVTLRQPAPDEVKGSSKRYLIQKTQLNDNDAGGSDTRLHTKI